MLQHERRKKTSCACLTKPTNPERGRGREKGKLWPCSTIICRRTELIAGVNFLLVDSARLNWFGFPDSSSPSDEQMLGGVLKLILSFSALFMFIILLSQSAIAEVSPVGKTMSRGLFTAGCWSNYRLTYCYQPCSETIHRWIERLCISGSNVVHWG